LNDKILCSSKFAKNDKQMIQLIASVAFVTFWNMNNLPLTLGICFKPFNCAPCLGFWVALGLMFAPELLSTIVAVSFGAGVIAAIVERLLMKLLTKL
jgi:hypothetical protein